MKLSVNRSTSRVGKRRLPVGAVLLVIGLIFLSLPLLHNARAAGGASRPQQLGNAANFTAAFDPSAGSRHSATIKIANDNSDAKAYGFATQGTGDNTAPTIDAATGLMTLQGALSPSNVTIATVADADSGAASVSVTIISANPATGVTISNIVNTDGVVTADLIADCAATDASFTLQASDGELTSTATLMVTVTASEPPQIAYIDQYVLPNGSLTINPDGGPFDDTAVQSITLQSQSTYTGTISVDNTTGVISISDAAPQGAHAITIRITDNCNVTTDATFTLNVAPPVTLTVKKTGNGSGTVTSEPSGINCGATCTAVFPQGSSVTLIARPDVLNIITGLGEASNNSRSSTVIMDGDKTVTARFAPVSAQGCTPDNPTLWGLRFNLGLNITPAAASMQCVQGGGTGRFKISSSTGFCLCETAQKRVTTVPATTGCDNICVGTNLPCGGPGSKYSVYTTTDYPVNAAVQLGSNAKVIADIWPADVTTATASATGSFSGLLTVDPVSGDVTITNAKPAGTFTVTVTANGASGPSTRSFTLTVTTPVNPCTGFKTFVPAAGSPFPAGDFASVAAVGDFNGDSKQDLAVTHFLSNTLTILLGDGAGGFAATASSPAVGSRTIFVAVGDFNGDGKQDLAATNSFTNQVSVLLGDGAGAFAHSPGSPFTVGTFPFALAVGDIDGDGDQDLVVANGQSMNLSVLVGDGAGGFAAAVNSPITVGPEPTSVALNDLNGDGKLDIAATVSGAASVVVLLGDGLGGFNPAAGSPFSTGDDPTFVAVGDFNSDNKMDLAVCNRQSKTITVLLGDGGGGFNQAGGPPPGIGAGAIMIVAGDFDGDGKLDLATSNVDSNDVTVLAGDGAGGFAGFAGSPYPTGSGPRSVAAGDFNGDGRLDLVTANGGSGDISVLLAGCGSSLPIITATSGLSRPQATTASATIATVSDPDQAASTLTVTVSSDGSIFGGFAFNNDVSISNISVDASGNVTADIETTCEATDATFTLKVRDQDNLTATATLNVTVTPNATPPPTLGAYTNAAVNLSSQILITPDAAPANATLVSIQASSGFGGLLTLNRSTGAVQVTNAAPPGTHTITLTATGGMCTSPVTRTFTVTVNTVAVCNPVFFNNAADVSVGASPIAGAIGDFNGDGKQDLAIANGTNNVSIRLGNGAGGFSGATNVSVGAFPQAIAIGDFNGDGNQDLATTSAGSVNVSIRLGNGAGNFSNAPDISLNNGTISIVVGDFNGDGKQDLAISKLTTPSVFIRLGDGAGNFSSAPDVNIGASATPLAIGDFNGDGKQDLAVGKNTNPIAIRLGNGNGSFSSAADVALPKSASSIAIGDFNADGKQDIAAAGPANNNVEIRMGDGAGGFTGTTSVSMGNNCNFVAIGDFNADGKQDLAGTIWNTVKNTPGFVGIRLGDGAGNFSGTTNFGVGTNPNYIGVGDFNGDGKQDFFTTNSFTTNNASVRLRGCANSAPTITAATGVTRLEGGGSSNSQIATVDDPESGAAAVTVTVTSANPSNGVTISNIVNTGGTVTANIVAACGATNATFTLQASDGSLTATAALNVTVTASTPSWSGATSSDWHTAANWGCAVPASGANVTLPASGVINEAAISSSDVTVNNLTLSANRTLAISGSRTLTVNGTLTMSGGNITVADGSTLIIGASGSVARTAGSIIGAVKKLVSSGSLPNTGKPNSPAAAPGFTFPVGTANGYSPVVATITGTGDLTIKANQGPQPDQNPTKALQRYWTLTGTGITASLTFSYLQADVMGNEAVYQLFRVVGGLTQHFPHNPPNVIIDTTNNTASISGVSQFSDWTLGEPSAPTAVDLASFKATGYDGGVLVEWHTGNEVSNLGFNVYREQAGRRTLINSDIIAGSALKVGPSVAVRAGYAYGWWDKASLSSLSSQDVAYYLEDLDINGHSTLHGPFKVEKVGGKPPAQSQAETLSHLTGGTVFTGPVALTTQPGKGSQATTPAQFDLAGKAAMKLTINSDGWYRVTQSELAAAGFDTRINPRNLQLFGDGVEQPLLVTGETDNSFDAGDALEFYATGQNTLSSDAHLYWLTAGAQPGKRVNLTKTTGKPGGAAGFLTTIERRERSIYFSGLLNGDAENFFGSVIASQPVEQPLSLSHIDVNAPSGAELEVALQGVTDLPGGADHSVSVALNGVIIGRVVFDGRQHKVERFSIYQSNLREGDNQITLMNEGGASDISLVDYIRVSYWHRYTADSDTLRLTASSSSGATQTIAGFTSPLVRVFDITDASAVSEIAGLIDAQKGAGYAVTVAVNGANRSLLAVTDAQIKRPAAITLNQVSTLRNPAQGADLVIVSRREFFTALAPLVALRQSQGLSVALVDVEDIYDEFNFGEKSVQSVKDFLAYTQTNWKKKPRFVLLGGDACYDAKNYLGLGNFDLVPTKLIDTGFMETASDDWLADFNNDGVAELAIGRLPMRTPGEAQVMIAKVMAYDRRSPSEEVTLSADENDGYSFEADSEQLRALLPKGLRINAINRGQMDADKAKAVLLDGINRGQKLINYTGHGSVDQWRGNLLTNADGLKMTNREGLSLFVLMTCLNGYFDDPALDSLAESLLKAEGGAVAVWASSGMCLPADQAVMNQEFYRQLFSGNPITIGEAVQRAKQATADADVRRTWILLGDPTMRLK